MGFRRNKRISTNAVGYHPLAPQETACLGIHLCLVSVDDRNPGADKKTDLCPKVRIKCLVPVQMLMSNVGKHSQGELHKIDPVLRQSVGRYFKNEMRIATIDCLPKVLLHLPGTRTGDVEAGVVYFTSNDGVDGSNHGNVVTGRFEDLVDERGRRRLAIRARDANDREVAAGESEPESGHQGFQPVIEPLQASNHPCIIAFLLWRDAPVRKQIFGDREKQRRGGFGSPGA